MTEDKKWKEIRTTIYLMAAIKPPTWFNACDTSTCIDRMENLPEPITAMPNEWQPRYDSEDWRNIISEHEHIYLWFNCCDSASCPDRLLKFYKNPCLLPKES